MNFADFVNGTCSICFANTMVRSHSNIYLFGSEGICMCDKCESKVRDFLNERRRCFLAAEMKGRRRTR